MKNFLSFLLIMIPLLAAGWFLDHSASKEGLEQQLKAQTLNNPLEGSDLAEHIELVEDRTLLENTRDEYVKMYRQWEQDKEDWVERLRRSERDYRAHAQELRGVYDVLHFQGIDPSLAETLRYTAKVCLNQRADIPCN